MLKYFKFIFSAFLLLIDFYSFSIDYNTIELNILTTSESVKLPDKNCSVILDNTINYSVTSKSEENNIFEIQALKIDQTSGTVIFSCEKSEYVYQITYSNIPPVLTNFYNYNFDQRKSSYSYSLFDSQAGHYSQLFQLTDNSYDTTYFQLTHNDQDILNKYFSNDIQAKYTGDWSQPTLVDYLNAGFDLSNGAVAYGLFYSYQFLLGFANYNLTFQRLKYNVDSNPTDTYTLALPDPFFVQANFYNKSDLSKEYNVQKIETISIQNLQSNNILTYDDMRPSDAAQAAGAFEIQTESLTDFTNYFFSPFIYQQLAFLYICKTSQTCNFNNFGTSFNFQNSQINSKFTYNLIPNQTSLYFQDYFWKVSDIIFYYNKVFDPWPFLQGMPVTYSGTASAENQFYSLVDARFLQGNWLYTLTLPLFYFNYMSSAALNIQYNSQNISGFCNFQILQDVDQTWSHYTWNFSLGLSYYPDFGIRQAVNMMKNHEINGVVFSNLNEPEGNVLVTIFLGKNKKMQTRSHSDGTYAFSEVPSSGVFKIVGEKNGIKNEFEFIKDSDLIVQKEDLQIPTHTIVDVHFYLANQKGENDKELLDIVNSNAGYSIVSAKGATYSQNKIFFVRKDRVKFEIHDEVLPFKYKIVRLSSNEIDTTKYDKMPLNVYLKAR